jgi:hypothetical protein
VTRSTLAVVAVALLLISGCGSVGTNPDAGADGSTTGTSTIDRTATTTVTPTRTSTATATQSATPTGPTDSDGDGLLDATEERIGSNASLRDTDGDGLNDSRERALGTNLTLADTDDDGLGDGAEVLATGALPGADPLHRDIYLEVDYMAGERPDEAMLETVTERFANAPVSNPDGESGIDLHVRIDEEVPARDSVLAANAPGELNDIFDYRREYSQLDRRGHYYGLVVAEIEYPNASARDLQGYAYTDFFASENTADPAVQDNVFMHELGHVVGLGPWRHPGIDSRRIPFEYYPSAMNYNAPGDHLRFSTGQGDAADFDDWRAIARCHGWAGYDDYFHAVDGGNRTTATERTLLGAGVGCL